MGEGRITRSSGPRTNLPHASCPFPSTTSSAGRQGETILPEKSLPDEMPRPPPSRTWRRKFANSGHACSDSLRDRSCRASGAPNALRAQGRLHGSRGRVGVLRQRGPELLRTVQFSCWTHPGRCLFPKAGPAGSRLSFCGRANDPQSSLRHPIRFDPTMSASKSSPAAAPVIRPVQKLMAANRSEIAVRIFRAGTELGLRTVAVYAQEDRFCIHRYKADESYPIGAGKGPVAAYLDIESIIGVARENGVDAIHPGYGFLAENAEFARACAEAGIIFVGPRVDLLDMMGDKTAARALAQRIGVPTLPGTPEPVTDRDDALRVAQADRVSADHQGGVRWRRPRDARRAKGGRPRHAARRSAGRGRPRVRQSRRVSREVHPAREAHRGADPRRPAWQRHPSARARLFGAAPPPEGHRSRTEFRPARVRDRASCAKPRRAWRGRSATTMPARSSFSTTSTGTSGSSSR